MRRIVFYRYAFFSRTKAIDNTPGGNQVFSRIILHGGSIYPKETYWTLYTCINICDLHTQMEA